MDGFEAEKRAECKIHRWGRDASGILGDWQMENRKKRTGENL